MKHPEVTFLLFRHIVPANFWRYFLHNTIEEGPMGYLSHRPLFYSKPLQQKTCGRQFGIRYISFYLLLSRIFTVSFARLHHFAPVRRILSFLTLHHRLESVGLHLTAPLMRMLMFLFVTSVIKAYIQQNGADCSNGCENRSSYKPGV